MNRLWWQLPGPEQFASNLAQKLRTGSSVVVRRPSHAPDGLAPAVRAKYGEANNGNRRGEGYYDWDWRTLVVPASKEVDPSYHLHTLFFPEHQPSIVCSPYSLSRQAELGGKVIWLDGITSINWPTWKTFLTEFSQASKSLPDFDRIRFCIPITGEVALTPLASNVCLTDVTWTGCVSRVDILLYVSHVLELRAMPDLHRQLATAIIAQVALWDPAVCDRLIGEPIDVLLQPHSILADIATERGWPRGTPSIPKDIAWAMGLADSYRNEWAEHSAALTSRGDVSQLEKRIWSAEIGVMLPFVEEHRRILVGQLEPWLSVPVPTPDGVITDKRDLEIGHIHYQTKNNWAISPETRRLVASLRNIRNRLSHLEPLRTTDLLNSSVARIAG